MGSRRTWSPPWYGWALSGLAALLFIHLVKPAKLEGLWLFVTPVGVCAGVLVLRRLWKMHPAVTMCAAIVTTIFAGKWGEMGLGGIPLDRVLVIMVLLQILLRAPGTASLPRIRVGNIHLLMCVALLYAVTSAAIAGTLGSEQGLLLTIDMFGLTPFVLFLVAPAVFAGQRERDMLLATLVGLGVYLGLTTIFESLGPHALVFPSYMRHVSAEAETLSEAKAGGPFQSPTANGFALFACAVAAVMALARWRSIRARRFAAGVAVLCLFSCMLTLERGVWISTVAGVVVVALATRQGRRWLLPGFALAALAVAAALVLSPQLQQQTSSRASDQQSLWDRQEQTSAGLRMVAAKPLLGFGVGRYERESLDYFREPAEYPMSGYYHGVTVGVADAILPIHDTYLAYAVELGLIGLVLWLTTIGWAVGGAIFTPGPRSLRPWKLGLLAAAVFYAIVGFVDPHAAPFPVMLIFLWAGLARGAAVAPARMPKPRLGGAALPVSMPESA
jgi:putative inorganic carbon (hco3(-)) transporter